MKYLHSETSDDALKMKIIALHKYKLHLEKALLEVKTELQGYITTLEAHTRETAD